MKGKPDEAAKNCTQGMNTHHCSQHVNKE